MYSSTNYKTKKAFKEAIKDGKPVTAFQPGGMFPAATEGWVTIEGPHYPKPHRWYAEALLEGGRVVKVK